MDVVYNNINYYSTKRERKYLIVFHDMIANIMNNKKFQAIIKVLFIRCKKLNISVVFIIQSLEIRLNSTHYLTMKIHNKREQQQIAIIHSADIDYKDFFKIYKKCTSKPYSFLNIDTTLPSNNPLWFRKNLLDPIQKGH